MSYKIAGIDVHKKVLMVVVIDASTPEGKPERRRFATMASDLRRLSTWLREQGARSGHGIDRAVLAVGMVGIGAVYAFAFGPGVLQPCPAWAQARLQRRRTFGAAADRGRVDLELCSGWGAAYLAQHDADEDAAHTGPGAAAESDGVSAGGDADQAVHCSQRSAGRQRASHAAGFGRGRDRPQEVGGLGRRPVEV